MAKTLLTLKKTTVALALLAAGMGVAQADQLADIKAAGVIKIATFDANPPFGSVDAQTHDLVGYDVDFANALAKALGVKLELVAGKPHPAVAVWQSGFDCRRYHHYPRARSGH